MTSLAYQVTEEDVGNVISSNTRTAQYASIPLEELATQLMTSLDFDEIEQAALYGDDINEQTDFANDEIAKQLRDVGVLNQLD